MESKAKKSNRKKTSTKPKSNESAATSSFGSFTAPLAQNHQNPALSSMLLEDTVADFVLDSNADALPLNQNPVKSGPNNSNNTFMQSCLFQYFRQTNWTGADRAYPALCASSQALLDFPTPNQFSMSVSKRTSKNLNSSYSIGIPNFRSAAFMFTSIPLSLSDNAELFSDFHSSISNLENPVNSEPEDPNFSFSTGSILQRFQAAAPLKLDTSLNTTDLETNFDLSETFLENSIIEKSNNSANLLNIKPKVQQDNLIKDYLLYGRLYQDASLEALVSRRISNRYMFITTANSSWNSQASSINSQLVRNGENWCTQLSYTSDDHIFGVNGLYNFRKSGLSAGGELYYTAGENSGGFSVGARYKNVSQTNSKSEPIASILTFLANPMMGHFQTSYTATVAPALNMSTRLEFNSYSYESDLAIGLLYAPEGQDQLLRARISPLQGLSLKLEGKYKQAIFGVGLMTEFGRNPKRSLGVEVQLF
ncbi:Mitochondrial distribution and morphology protein 10 [Nowakowskiella sp. JEL0078]|nr:Mitochondrial distribution and morphology protein 10 [Nowakowskiella sp. JEL0078]